MPDREWATVQVWCAGCGAYVTYTGWRDGKGDAVHVTPEMMAEHRAAVGHG